MSNIQYPKSKCSHLGYWTFLVGYSNFTLSAAELRVEDEASRFLRWLFCSLPRNPKPINQLQVPRIVTQYFEHRRSGQKHQGVHIVVSLGFRQRHKG